MSMRRSGRLRQDLPLAGSSDDAVIGRGEPEPPPHEVEGSQCPDAPPSQTLSVMD